MTFPVIEVFGPTIQGEGADQGVATHFVRFGGCDFRCTWCDTPYAVLPNEVRENAEKMDVETIVEEVLALPKAPWVILSGGNPALHELGPLVVRLQFHGYLVAVETQGSRWKQWLSTVDRLCISPKPPSALEAKSTLPDLEEFLWKALESDVSMFLKIPCFDHNDLEFVEEVRRLVDGPPLYLTAGNDAGRTVGQPERKDPRDVEQVRTDLCSRFQWLVETVLEQDFLGSHPRVFLQLQSHVLVWGNQQGR